MIYVFSFFSLLLEFCHFTVRCVWISSYLLCLRSIALFSLKNLFICTGKVLAIISSSGSFIPFYLFCCSQIWLNTCYIFSFYPSYLLISLSHIFISCVLFVFNTKTVFYFLFQWPSFSTLESDPFFKSLLFYDVLLLPSCCKLSMRFQFYYIRFFEANCPLVMGFQDVASGQEPACQSLGWEDPLEEGKATHSSILDWRIPWTEEPGGLQSTGRKESDTTEAT